MSRFRLLLREKQPRRLLGKRCSDRRKTARRIHGSGSSPKRTAITCILPNWLLPEPRHQVGVGEIAISIGKPPQGALVFEPDSLVQLDRRRIVSVDG